MFSCIFSPVFLHSPTNPTKSWTPTWQVYSWQLAATSSHESSAFRCHIIPCRAAAQNTGLGWTHTFGPNFTGSRPSIPGQPGDGKRTIEFNWSCAIQSLKYLLLKWIAGWSVRLTIPRLPYYSNPFIKTHIPKQRVRLRDVSWPKHRVLHNSIPSRTHILRHSSFNLHLKSIGAASVHSDTSLFSAISGAHAGPVADLPVKLWTPKHIRGLQTHQ